LPKVGSFGDLGAEVGGPVFVAVLLHLLVFDAFRSFVTDESGDEGLVRRPLYTDGQSYGGGGGGVLGFVASDGVSEGVYRRPTRGG
jgi:hypothetical protein